MVYFNLCDVKGVSTNCVVIRNLPYGYRANLYEADELIDMILEECGEVINVKQGTRTIYGDVPVLLPVMRVWMESEEAAGVVEKKMNGREFEGRRLIVKRVPQ